jgi:hypothetical protein
MITVTIETTTTNASFTAMNTGSRTGTPARR